MSIPTLEAAFRATAYRVETPGECFDLRIGQCHPGFDDFLRRQGVSSWGILTACNPGALALPADENLRRQEQLRARLSKLGRLSFAGCNVADDGDWPAEPSRLILQIGEEDLQALAREFAQLAAVYGRIGSAPCLLWV